MTQLKPTIICQNPKCKTENRGDARFCIKCGEPLPKPVRIFISYAHEDEHLEKKLITHLSPLQRVRGTLVWHDRDIKAGNDWTTDIDNNLLAADIILLLVSADFMVSAYCYSVEMKAAMERNEKGEARVIPIILRPTELEGTPFMKLQALPHGAKPVSRWSDIDDALLDVVKGIKAVL